jgi:capsid protein
VIANDLEGVNFSSARAGELEQRKVWKEFQQLMIEEFLEDQFEEWGAMSLLRKDFDFDRGKLQKVISMELYEFVPQGWPWVDPVKEMEANKLALDLRLTTRQAIISESSGGDFTDIVDQLGEEKKYMESKGVAPLDEVEVEQQANSQPAE